MHTIGICCLLVVKEKIENIARLLFSSCMRMKRLVDAFFCIQLEHTELTIQLDDFFDNWKAKFGRKWWYERRTTIRHQRQNGYSRAYFTGKHFDHAFDKKTKWPTERTLVNPYHKSSISPRNVLVVSDAGFY